MCAIYPVFWVFQYARCCSFPFLLGAVESASADMDEDDCAYSDTETVAHDDALEECCNSADDMCPAMKRLLVPILKKREKCRSDNSCSSFEIVMAFLQLSWYCSSTNYDRDKKQLLKQKEHKLKETYVLIDDIKTIVTKQTMEQAWYMLYNMYNGTSDRWIVSKENPILGGLLMFIEEQKVVSFHDPCFQLLLSSACQFWCNPANQELSYNHYLRSMCSILHKSPPISRIGFSAHELVAEMEDHAGEKSKHSERASADTHKKKKKSSSSSKSKHTEATGDDDTHDLFDSLGQRADEKKDKERLAATERLLFDDEDETTALLVSSKSKSSSASRSSAAVDKKSSTVPPVHSGGIEKKKEDRRAEVKAMLQRYKYRCSKNYLFTLANELDIKNSISGTKTSISDLWKY